MKFDLYRTLLADLLPRTEPLSRRLGAGALWRRLRSSYAHGCLPVRPRLHGQRLWLNAGNPYPFTLRAYPRFNAGLVGAVELLHRESSRPLRVIDVGASVGDTVALLGERCPGALARCLCIEGDAGLAGLFALNVGSLPGVTLVSAMLTAEKGDMPALVKHHPGTASAVGGSRVPATTLDHLLTAEPAGWDLLKIDVDGYDGAVLAGATHLLQTVAPVICFEWHPRLAQAAGQAPASVFVTLRTAGYRTLVWFDNRGPFSHFSTIPTDGETAAWEELLAPNLENRDAHFDIVALPPAWERLAVPLAAQVGR